VIELCVASQIRVGRSPFADRESVGYGCATMTRSHIRITRAIIVIATSA
jgi:hypothetical protein